MSPSRWLVLLTVAAAAACGGSNSNTATGPSSTSKAVTGLALTGTTDLLKIGATQQFIATATLSDGTTQTAQATWGSDAPVVASPDNNGSVRALGSGLATVYADYGGLRATHLLRVIPDYGGTWTGAYRPSHCTVTGDWIGYGCTVEDPGAIYGLSAAFGQTQTAVSGTLFQGELSVSGTIATDGTLALSGSETVVIDNRTWYVQVADWQSQTQDNLHMTGHFTVVDRLDDVNGSSSDLYEIIGMSRTPNLPITQRSSRSLLNAPPRAPK